MAEVIGRFKKGKVTLTVIKGKYNGNDTTSFTIKKSILKDKQWKETDFLTITDLQDVLSLVTRTCSDYVKYEPVKKNNGG